MRRRRRHISSAFAKKWKASNFSEALTRTEPTRTWNCLIQGARSANRRFINAQGVRKLTLKSEKDFLQREGRSEPVSTQLDLQP
jgi:hypothetical protein